MPNWFPPKGELLNIMIPFSDDYSSLFNFSVPYIKNPFDPILFAYLRFPVTRNLSIVFSESNTID